MKDEYEQGFADGRNDAKEENEERFEEHYNDGWQDGFDHAIEQHGKDADELKRQLRVKDQEIDLLRKRLVSLSKQMEDLAHERNVSWQLGYDSAIEDVMEKESG